MYHPGIRSVTSLTHCSAVRQTFNSLHFRHELRKQQSKCCLAKDPVFELLTLVSQIKTLAFHYIHLLLLLASNARQGQKALPEWVPWCGVARKRVWGGSCLIARSRKKFKEAFSAAEETVDEFLVR